MCALRSFWTSNRLIERLPDRSQGQFLECCTQVELELNDVLCEPLRPMQFAYFPQSCFISMVAALNGELPLGIRLVGNEGMLGATLILGPESVMMRGTVKQSGSALRVPAQTLVQAAQDNPALLDLLHRYLYLSMLQLTRSSICNHGHKIRSRVAFWLLMTHDCSPADSLQLTHESLSDVLGVRRSSVTLAAGELQQKNLILYKRGEIHILSRRGLEQEACRCYAAMKRDYCHLLGTE